MKSRPFEVDAAEYPFKDHWFERDGCAMHYVDEGNGVPVVFCHGNPTWSYLYRKIIPQLSSQYRCIAYDLPGFGFSEHPPSFGYTPQEHAQWVEALLLEYLKLDRFVLVMQDWGGPIGLSIAAHHPEKIAALVISSTWAWRAQTVGRAFSALASTRLIQHLILQRNFFAKAVVPWALCSKPSLQTLKAYTDPFPTPESRKGTAVFPVQIVAAGDWLEQIEQGLTQLADKPVEFVFGLRDLMTRPGDIEKWLRHFPRAGVQKIASAGHYTQEDCPENYVTAVQRVFSRL